MTTDPRIAALAEALHAIQAPDPPRPRCVLAGAGFMMIYATLLGWWR